MAVTQFIGPKHSLRRQTSNSRSHHVGQGVGEYAVILGCVALLCVGVLSVLGSQLEGMLQGGVRFQGAPTASSLANVNNPANSAVNSAAGQPQPSNTPTTDQNPDTTTAPATTSPSPNALPDSLLHALNATSNGSLKDFSAAIETAAASGATNLYLAQLDAVIKTLEAQPTASTETIANLKALS
ncbi:MAG: hypothetical protein SFZ03_06455, partial [Candidatus Melainabacteria bacterium]|nr:hypothetical protein [Candidatus Melainabacteria bacterium]